MYPTYLDLGAKERVVDAAGHSKVQHEAAGRNNAVNASNTSNVSNIVQTNQWRSYTIAQLERQVKLPTEEIVIRVPGIQKSKRIGAEAGVQIGRNSIKKFDDDIEETQLNRTEQVGSRWEQTAAEQGRTQQTGFSLGVKFDGPCPSSVRLGTISLRPGCQGQSDSIGSRSDAGRLLSERFGASSEHGLEAEVWESCGALMEHWSYGANVESAEDERASLVQGLQSMSNLLKHLQNLCSQLVYFLISENFESKGWTREEQYRISRPIGHNTRSTVNSFTAFLNGAGTGRVSPPVYA
ncbi:hypothetical protein C8R45DRAFT_941898 [Mycena sanguinolenta]|nr:hypothetical protein C8R45DRAFT_941898 [Mycena sanguinolenta]